MSQHSARVAARHLRQFADEFEQPNAWRAIEAAVRFAETGWPPGFERLDDRIDAVADAAELDRGVLQAWTHAAPFPDDAGVWAQRVSAGLSARRELYKHAREIDNMLGVGEVSAVLDELRGAA